MDSDQVAHFLELEDKLSEVRSRINSKLNNHKHVAIILSAVEENIDEQQSTSKNVVAYLVSFMSLLDQSVDSRGGGGIVDQQLATSSVYLLDMIYKYAPKGLLKSKFAELLTKIAPCITDDNAQAPLIRSAIGCLESLLVAQDAQAWNNTQNMNIAPTRGLGGLLELSLDHRPKIRKRAQEAVCRVLANPPASPSAEHMAAGMVAQFVIDALGSSLESVATNKNTRDDSSKEHAKLIHILKLASSVLTTNQWPFSKVDKLCDLLLEALKTSDQYLVSSAFSVFESLFGSLANAASQGLADSKFIAALDMIFASRPSNKDSHLAGAWIAVVSRGISTFAACQPQNCLQKLPQVFNTLKVYLESENAQIYTSASQSMVAILSEGIKDELLLYPPANTPEVFEATEEFIGSLAETFVDLLSIRFIHCAKEVLGVLAMAFTKFKMRSNPDFLQPLEIIGEWRSDESRFSDLRVDIEAVIAAAITAVGPDAVLGCLPLNLLISSAGNPGRAWLIPLIRDNTRNSELRVFVRELLPLAQHFESVVSKLGEDSLQKKVFETLIDQIWSTLPSFCELPSDLKTAFSDEFAAELSSLLYSRVDLRPTICRAFKNLIDSNRNFNPESDPMLAQRLTESERESNLEFLSAKAYNLLAVLFNVYSQTTANARGYVADTIDVVLAIAPVEDLVKTFDNTCALLKNALEQEALNNTSRTSGQVSMSATLLDLVVLMAAYVPPESYNALLSIFNTTVNSSDGLLQKRAYRILSKLSENEKAAGSVAQYVGNIETIIVESQPFVQTSSKAARLNAILSFVDLLPQDHLDFIVRIVSEVILACKDVNEKSREGAFAILTKMAKKMSAPGGMIKLSKISGYEAETPDQRASLDEFFKIISAGLIGESQHMVSATVTAYACLVFEFRDRLDSAILLDIYDTIELYLTSNSREIVKSAIGFVKVCCLGLSVELMRPKIPSLIPKLLRWSHEHTGHFKAKVKHIIERLIRKFGYDYIEANFPEEDLKLLANIRKTRNRSKKKGIDNDGADALGNRKSHEPKFMSALDDAIYHSSDSEESDGEEDHKQSKSYIVESKNNPLDLLDSQTLAHISSTRPKKFIKNLSKNKENEIFKFDAEGKLVLKEESGAKAQDDTLSSVTSGINAYLEAVKHGPVRGQKNKLKFKKGKKVADDDISDGETEAKVAGRVDRKNRNAAKKGSKFKAKRKF
ncbi:LAMI_0F12684g1_1 [Lachancea mirantina]|uniref:LAMI_0F12684g1_1 n=1 Tax=Lachancea mirantina TaxID=1230905 RepID=A0A1G4K3B0_9SACH|nr:LAMI_0F12684g1_1 [Lachancea mirantina]